MTLLFRFSALTFALVASAWAPARAEGDYYRFADLFAAGAASEADARHVSFYLADDPLPTIAETSRADVFSGTGISLSPFGGSRRHCLEAFDKIVKSIVVDAAERGYDTVLDLQTVVDNRPTGDRTGFRCTPGYKVTRVAVSARLAMTPNAAERMRLEEERSLRPSRRALDPAVRRLPLADVLEMPEAGAITGPAVSVHAGIRAPAYAERYGPNLYSGEATLKDRGPEDACRAAALDALKAMVADARDKGYDAIVKLRSRLDDAYSPVDSEFECRVGRKTVDVELQASLANLGASPLPRR